jgi:hypothetical protein
MAQETALRSISLEINKMGQETGQFRKLANQQNNSISSFIKDISRLFSTNTNQQGELNNNISELQQTSAQTNQKVDQTNYLMQNSISIQSQMLNEIKNSSSTLRELYNLSLNNSNAMENQQGLLGGPGSSILSMIGRFLLGGAALGAGGLAASEIFGSTNILGALNDQASGMGEFRKMFTGISPDTSSNLTPTSNISASSGSNLSVSDMSRYALEAGFTPEQARIMGAIGMAESSGNPGIDTIQSGLDPSMEKEYSIGWAQINWKAHKDTLAGYGITDPNQLRDPLTNAKAAKIVFDGAKGSFSPWATYTKGDYATWLEKDDEFAPPGTISPQNSPTNNYGGSVYEKQREMAGIRKLPLSSRLRGVLEQAAAAAGVDVVVYSGGQPPKGSGGPRTGSTRHDNGNAADLFLVRNGRKLADTNPEDKAIMAKFVSAAVSAGATGVGAGHNYMGPSEIHVGFGNPATWGGADWIKQAAAGILNNIDISGSMNNGYGSVGFNFGSQGFNMSAGMGGNISPLSLATPMMPFGMMGLESVFGGLPGLFGGLITSGIGDMVSSLLGKEESEEEYLSQRDNNMGDKISGNDSALENKTNSIQNAAIQSDPTLINAMSTQRAQTASVEQQQIPATPINTAETYIPMHGSTSSPSWYLQLAGRINNDETMKFKGGVFA